MHAILLLLTLSQASPIPPGQPDLPVEGPGLALEVSALADLHFHLRASLADPASEVPPGPLSEALSAARELARALGDERLFALLEGALAQARDARELLELWQRLPATSRLRDGRELAFRAEALRYASTLADAEEAFRAELWPARERQLAAACEAFRDEVGSGAAVLAAAARSLALDLPAAPCRVVLVEGGPRPGGWTVRTPRGSVSFVTRSDPDGTPRGIGELVEVALHEALHQLDEATQGDVLDRVRALLRGEGPAAARRAEDVAHALIFAAAGETVRRELLPDHRPYGLASGIYARMGPAAEAAHRLWAEHLAGERDLEATLRALEEASRAAGD